MAKRPLKGRLTPLAPESNDFCSKHAAVSTSVFDRLEDAFAPRLRPLALAREPAVTRVEHRAEGLPGSFKLSSAKVK